MYVAVSADAVAVTSADSCRTAEGGSLAQRVWRQLAAARASRAERAIGELLREAGHRGAAEDFRQACRRR